MASVSHYVVQNRIDQRYVTGNGMQGKPFGMTADIDKAEPCDNEAAADFLLENYRAHCRREGRRTIPGKGTLVVVPVEKAPDPKTWWERL